MTSAPQDCFQSVADYLASELLSDIRREYIGGLTYPMVDVTVRHSLITGAIQSNLYQYFKIGAFEVVASTVKIFLKAGGLDVFYYPDVFVNCAPIDSDSVYCETPKVVFEVFSPATEGTDRREKFWNYIQIDSLEEYILVAQDRIEVTVFRRNEHWRAETYTTLGEAVPLKSLNLTIPMQAIYGRSGL
jgi:Uma2 family endonuclease